MHSYKEWKTSEKQQVNIPGAPAQLKRISSPQPRKLDLGASLLQHIAQAFGEQVEA